MIDIFYCGLVTPHNTADIHLNKSTIGKKITAFFYASHTLEFLFLKTAVSKSFNII